MYSPGVLDHFKFPRNAGDLPGATAIVEVSNPACGDILQLAVKVEASRIAETRFKARGCATSMACGSFLTELMLGKSSAELRAITPDAISHALGDLPSATFHGAQLACDALAALLQKIE